MYKKNSMKEKEELHPKESLDIIQTMIQAEKMRFSENGFIYRMWGWLVLVAAVSQFILLQLELYSYHYYPWFLMIFGSIYTGIYYGKKKKTTHLPFSGKILAFTWIAISINIFGVAFVLSSMADNFLLFIILTNIAIGVIVAGALLDFKWLLIGGFICIIIGFVSLFIPHVYWNLLTVIAILFTNLIPGYLMKKNSN